MEFQTADNLAEGLRALEQAKDDLLEAPKEQRAAAAEAYLRTRKETSPAFAAAQSEFDLAEAGASTPGTPPDPTAPHSQSPAPSEIAPDVALVQSPGTPVTTANIHAYGALVGYQAKGDDAGPVIHATPYAFDAGTVVVTEAGEVALEQPSRVIVPTETGENGEALPLGVVTQDVFAATYEEATPREAAPPEAPAPEAPAEPTA